MFNLNNAAKQKRLTAEDTTAAKPQTEASTPQNGEEASAKAAQRKMAEIYAQAEAYAKENPDFDIKAESKNEDFVSYICRNGLSVEDAYFLVHREELLEKARTEAIEEHSARAGRIRENGTSKNRPAIVSKNPNDLTDKEIDDIIRRARNGERITF